MKKLNILVLFLLCSSLFSVNAFSQTEEQRKYVFKSISSEFIKMINSGNVNGISTKKHSDYTYIDLYLDTDDLDLYKNNLSLRIRKRNFGDGTVEYGMQLKSEMLVNGQARMEVEEDELNFYNIVLADNSKVKLQDELNIVFNRFIKLIELNPNVQVKDDAVISSKIDNINTWISFKLNAAIAPFQKLNRMKLISKLSLRTLKPVLIGKSNRQRVHVFINRKDTADDLTDFPVSTRASSSTPSDLRDTNLIWTMEASFDSAKFYPLSNTLINDLNFHQINEFEVENKYLPHANSKVIMDRFQNSMIQDYKAQINLESKYKQSIKGLSTK
jgi:hypothetical protein